MKRRRFLQLSAAGLAGASVLGLRRARHSQAAPFGERPSGVGDVLLPEKRRAKRVLEIFLYGGLSPWESLYMVPDYGRPDDPNFPNQQFHAFANQPGASVESTFSACGFPAEALEGYFFGQDALGADVRLGPFAHRLAERADMTSRMRILVQRHELEPHEAAVPQALTGSPVGRPSAAGLGAHVQRYFSERAAPARSAPHSYVFAVGGIAGDNVSAAAATGFHPGLARPLSINITNVDGFADRLARDTVGSQREVHDALTDIYADQFQRRMRWPGRDVPVRSAARFDLEEAARTVKNVDAIASVMDPELFLALGGESCSAARGFDVPGMSLRAARHLLTHPTAPAHYVCVSDIGLFEASGGGGYDCHSANSADTAMNFDNLLRNLTAIVNRPDEADPTKLDLDDTLIILNTEFGRTALPQGATGRNHHPYGYATAFIGGPIQTEQSGVFGAIGPNSFADPDRSVTPAENRIGALLALGIWPFAQEAFAVSDVRDAPSEEQAARIATEKLLGISL